MFQKIQKKKREISLIPLINVIFLMLIFFMVAGTVEKLDIFEVKVPQAKNSKDEPVEKATIYISADGKMAVNNDIVAEKNLPTIIATILIDDLQQEILIKSDAKVDALKIVKLMKIIEKQGGHNISLITQVVNK